MVYFRVQVVQPQFPAHWSRQNRVPAPKTRTSLIDIEKDLSVGSYTSPGKGLASGTDLGLAYTVWPAVVSANRAAAFIGLWKDTWQLQAETGLDLGTERDDRRKRTE